MVKNITKESIYIGLMSGTSMDAIDGALVSFQGDTPTLLGTISEKIPNNIKKMLSTLMQPTASIKLYGEMDTELGLLFADTANLLIHKYNIKRSDIMAIGSHGQTIYHHPNHTSPFTLQIGDPNIITAKTDITTVADFRRRDIALGGQGAPLAPAFHANLFRKKPYTQWILNLGGIANITQLSANSNQETIGFDTGPANTLLDQWHFKNHGIPIDLNGNWASSGTIDQALLTAMLNDQYFKKTHPKSTGREYFNLQWLEKYNIKAIAPQNIQATLTELTAITVAQNISNPMEQDIIWVCGGGAYNTYLMKRLQHHCQPAKIQTTDILGIQPEWIEAIAFAWLAKQTIENKPGNLPNVTGASKASVLGAIYPCNNITTCNHPTET